MIFVADSVNFPVMSKKTGTKLQTSFRISTELLNHVRDFAENLPVKPSVTAVIETAVRDFLERHEKPVSKPTKPRRSPPPPG